MATIPQISAAMQTVLGTTADRLGWQTGFNQRQSKVTGRVMVQSLVFSSLGEREVGYPSLVASALDAGVAVSAQGLAQRFSPQSAELCRQVLDAAVGQLISGRAVQLELLQRFSGLYLRDSSVVSLPPCLATLWPGVGGSSGATAAVKLQVQLEYSQGQLQGPSLQSGRTADTQSPYQTNPLPAGAIRMGDLGYFALRQFHADQRQGVYTFSRFKIGTCLYDCAGQTMDLLAWLQAQSGASFERETYLGKRARFRCRLIAIRLPQEAVDKRRHKLKEYARKKQVTIQAETYALAAWNIIITDIPVELLSIAEAIVLLAVRWQIELLFKLWKSQFQIDTWRSRHPWRILTELYARLISVVLLHWTFLVDLWQAPDRSLWKAAACVRRFAVALACALPDRFLLETILAQIMTHFRHCSRQNSRRARPGTAQRLAALSRPLSRTLT